MGNVTYINFNGAYEVEENIDLGGIAGALPVYTRRRDYDLTKLDDLVALADDIQEKSRDLLCVAERLRDIAYGEHP